MSKRPTDIDQARFLRDVAEHQVTIVHDVPSAAVRVIRFAKPGSSIRAFTLTTWPGYLAYSGDMGTFVFARLRDMFECFRAPADTDLDRRINPGYWAEKVEAACREGVKEFRVELFKERIQEWLDGMEASPELRQAVADEMPSDLQDGDSNTAYAWAMQFSDDGNRPVFQDFWEVDCTEYTFRFMWCCYALVWGIDQYDRARQAATAAPEVAHHHV